MLAAYKVCWKISNCFRSVAINRATLDKLVRRSFKLLEKVQHDGQRHFSFILDGNDVLSIGVNNPRKTDPIALTHYKYHYAHAEAIAIKRFIFPPIELKGMSMVNIRISKNGSLCLSKPCNGCQRFLAAFELREIWFSTSEGCFEIL